MADDSNRRLNRNLVVLLLLLIFARSSQALRPSKTEVFLSPEFVLEPGSVSNRYYYNIDFPRGHIALKNVNVEVVDDKGNPVPLHETYQHHWLLLRYFYRKRPDGRRIKYQNTELEMNESEYVIFRNEGVCDDIRLPQYYGLGSETRRTSTQVPDPYGIEVGNPKEIPDGYEEGWILQVHAIDTRGVEDKIGCCECRCDLFNVTAGHRRVLPRGYVGGLRCCLDGMRCKLKEGFQGVKRSLYLRYTVQYVDWDVSIIPVNVYILDITDIWTKADESRGLEAIHDCQNEYDIIESCPVGVANDSCSHTKTLTVGFPVGGDVIYAVGHQHTGGIGIALYGEGGRLICSSDPIYGNGTEPGNEAGYIVGMTTCYPSPAGSVKISAGEVLTFVSNYSSSRAHTGVMGLFYILLDDSSSRTNSVLQAPAKAHMSMRMANFSWVFALFGIAVVIFMLRGKSGKKDGYGAI